MPVSLFFAWPQMQIWESEKLKCRDCSISRGNRACLKLADLYTSTYPLAAVAQGSVEANSGSCDCSADTV